MQKIKKLLFCNWLAVLFTFCLPKAQGQSNPNISARLIVVPKPAPVVQQTYRYHLMQVGDKTHFGYDVKGLGGGTGALISRTPLMILFSPLV